ncbi:MAG TPA: sugar phosphate isomerase/epimerase family protein [Verrucomicrobiota bacterium]|nr:sugar phosphate isomerase/epimerase family protein [Verrucomicrobiota bacterium]
MKVSRSRREFFGLSLAAAGCGVLAPPAAAVEPFQRGGTPRLKLSLAAYSFRDEFQPKKDAPVTMDMFKFVDYCAEHDCDGAELTSYYFPDHVTDEYLAQVRRHAHLRGVSVSGTAVGNDFCHPPGPQRQEQQALVADWIRKAAILGAPHIRVFAGGPHQQTKEEAKKLCIAAMEEAAAAAGRQGIFLGIENHGGIVAEADDLLDIVRAVNSPWVGINLDTGNFRTDDPYGDLAKCAPYAVNVQFKGRISRRGQKGAEPADFPRTFQILRDANYQGWVALEFEFEEDPRVRVPTLLKEMRAQMG